MTLLYSSHLRSLGIPHAFSTRTGGVSAGPFDSLNFGNPSDLSPDRKDPRDNIAENWRRISAQIGAAGRRVVEVHQVHGAACHVTPLIPAEPDPKADAIVTTHARHLVAVRVADCTPILLASRDGRAVAAVHAGWRGVIAGVLPAAVAQLRAMGFDDLVAAFGPCIGPDAFEVGPEVVAEFTRVFGTSTPIVRHRSDGKGHIDLQSALKLQLLALDVRDIDVIPGCTASESDRFFSHRRDLGITGRMVGVIGPR